ncbi:hypothetical protein R3P38DRAFT_2511819, partial [Favolaschia claudopus]
RLHTAIMELKPKPPTTTDKKTIFWNGYMVLANEYDKEFLQKYGTELDTSLIFAGLFSAVASAFIIQIQPEFESDPHPLTVIAQSLLYISLGSTLLAALLAVLGKQWLIYYSAAGKRGTTVVRGRERQRKLNAIRKWKFEVIMQAFPLLLQFGLFLFASALSVYLWRIHQVLAGIVLSITAGGAIAYLALLASAIFFKDSPFQTPLAPFLKAMWLLINPRYWHITEFYSSAIHQSKDLLPKFAFELDSDRTAGLVTLFNKPPSSEVSGMAWVLESSTDPILLAQARDMCKDLHWPLDKELAPSWQSILNQHRWQWPAFYSSKSRPITYPYNTIKHLKSVVAELDSDISLTCSGFAEYLFFVYLNLINGHICAYDVLSFIHYPEIMLRLHPLSPYELWLYEKILTTLLSKLNSEQIDMKFIADILKLTLQLASNCKDHRKWDEQWNKRQILAYRFGQALPQTDGWIQVICTPGLLSSKKILYESPPSNPDTQSWIQNALACIPSPLNEQGEYDDEIVGTIDNLWCALYQTGTPPSKDSLKLIIQLLSLPGPLSFSAALLLLQENVHEWYTQPEFGQKLWDHSLWTLLSNAMSQHWRDNSIHMNLAICNRYVKLANLLLAIPKWHPCICKELCSWIYIFPAICQTEQESLEQYNIVFKTIWAPHLNSTTHNHLEEAIGLVYVTLSDFWASVDLAMLVSPNTLLAWL